MSDDERTRQLLKTAYDMGLEEGRASASKAVAVAQAEPSVNNVQLQEQFNARLADLKLDRRKNPTKFRALQAEFLEAGLSMEDMDITNYSRVSDERWNDLGSGLAFRRRR